MKTDLVRFNKRTEASTTGVGIVYGNTISKITL